MPCMYDARPASRSLISSYKVTSKPLPITDIVPVKSSIVLSLSVISAFSPVFTTLRLSISSCLDLFSASKVNI